MKTKVRPVPKGRAVDPKARDEVRALLGDAAAARDLLIEHLHRINDRYGHLSAAHLAALAEEMRLSLTEVYEVATFYHHFDVVKEGEAAPPALTVRVCDSISCELAGAQDLLKRLRARQGRARDPGALRRPLRSRRRARWWDRTRSGNATVDRSSRSLPEATLVPRRPLHRLRGVPRRRAATQLLADCLAGKRTREDITKIMEDSGLRGLGGAGFPAGRKWRFVAAEPAPRLMAVNIDEGEPGTFKDRWYLERTRTACSRACSSPPGARAWARSTSTCATSMRAAARSSRRTETLKADPPCALPPIHLRRGAGAYICGEESAMIESIEGKRGMPRLRPPYVAQVGPVRPADARAQHGNGVLGARDRGEGRRSGSLRHGRHGRKGLRSFSVSGRVKKPGVHLAPAGITVKD